MSVEDRELDDVTNGLSRNLLVEDPAEPPQGDILEALSETYGSEGYWEYVHGFGPEGVDLIQGLPCFRRKPHELQQLLKNRPDCPHCSKTQPNKCSLRCLMCFAPDAKGNVVNIPTYRDRCIECDGNPIRRVGSADEPDCMTEPPNAPSRMQHRGLVVPRHTRLCSMRYFPLGRFIDNSDTGSRKFEPDGRFSFVRNPNRFDTDDLGYDSDSFEDEIITHEDATEWQWKSNTSNLIRKYLMMLGLEVDVFTCPIMHELMKCPVEVPQVDPERSQGHVTYTEEDKYQKAVSYTYEKSVIEYYLSEQLRPRRYSVDVDDLSTEIFPAWPQIQRNPTTNERLPEYAVQQLRPNKPVFFGLLCAYGFAYSRYNRLKGILQNIRTNFIEAKDEPAMKRLKLGLA